MTTTDKPVKECITTSAIVFRRSDENVLLVYNRDFDCWVYPGGHLEDVDHNAFDRAAMREVEEETGVKFRLIGQRREAPGTTSQVAPWNVYGMTIVYPDGEVHEHTDLLYVGVAADDAVLIAQDEEVSDVRWVPTYKLHTMKVRPDVLALTVLASLEVFGPF